MCGIVGIVGADAIAALEQGQGRPASHTLERMTSLLGHRGPDSRGTWKSGSGTAYLGHTRLSILDLSSAGDQPMEDQGQVLVYNGEVYNFRDLQRELPGPFRSQSDTEVVLRCFRTLGPDGIPKLHGMFAFAVWDERTRELVLVRDRFGIKPLYYRPLGGPPGRTPGSGTGGLAFASEVAPLLELGAGKGEKRGGERGRPEIDLPTLRDYFTYGYIPTPKTPWKGIYKLPAAHFLRWRDSELGIHRYWTLEAREGAQAFDPTQAAEETEELLRQAVRESAVSDVPLGLFLSGGVDSGSIAAFSSPSILAFTLSQPERHRDETQQARLLCRHLGIRHHVLPAEDLEDLDLSDALDTLVSTFGEPFGDSAALSVWLLSRLVREHVKVALSGEGGDEMFYGYRWHGRAMTDPPSRLSGLLARVLPPLTKPGRSSQRRSLEGLERYAAFVGTFTPRQVRRLAGPALVPDHRSASGDGPEDDDPLWHFRRYWRDDLPIQQSVQLVDFHTYLPDDLLTKVDRASMAWSLEVRPPLLDHRLAELSVALPPEIHRDPTTDRGKSLLRRVAATHLPEGYLERPKRGFNLAIARWIKKQPELWRSALGRLESHGIVRPSRVLDLTNEQVWSLLVLDRWLVTNQPGYR